MPAAARAASDRALLALLASSHQGHAIRFCRLRPSVSLAAREHVADGAATAKCGARFVNLVARCGFSSDAPPRWRASRPRASARRPGWRRRSLQDAVPEQREAGRGAGHWQRLQRHRGFGDPPARGLHIECGSSIRASAPVGIGERHGPIPRSRRTQRRWCGWLRSRRRESERRSGDAPDARAPGPRLAATRRRPPDRAPRWATTCRGRRRRRRRRAPRR